MLLRLHPEFGGLFENQRGDGGSEADIGRNRRRELIEESRRLFLSGFLTLMFDTDRQSESYCEARELINDGSFGYSRLDLIAKRLFG